MTIYFFYPIQQCAQQIHHTAFPLLPLTSLDRLDLEEHDRTHISDFLGAPSDWGMLLTTISVGPRRPTAIAAFAEKIAIAYEDVVNIYDAVTFVLEQSLRTPQSVTRIRGSTDGSFLYSTHTRSVALWDIQTGGLIDTFHTQSGIDDTVVSHTDGHIACRLSDGSVVFRNGRTKNEDSFQIDQPVVTICWLPPGKPAVRTTKLPPAELAIATKNEVYTVDIDTGSTSTIARAHDTVWGMAVLGSDRLIVGTSKPGAAGERELCSLSPFTRRQQSNWNREPYPLKKGLQPTFRGPLTSPMAVGEKIVCITPPNGVQVFNTPAPPNVVQGFDTPDLNWTEYPFLLQKAKSLAESLDRNLVVQTEDSVQIFSFKVLTGEPNWGTGVLSHVYPLGEKHAVCLRIDRRLTIIELETLKSLEPGVDSSSLVSSLMKSSTSASCSRGLVAEFGISMVVRSWRTLAPLPRWAEGAEGDTLLGGLSPTCTLNATLYSLPRRELRVNAAENGTTLAMLRLEDDGPAGTGVPYDLAFDSETRFYLKVDAPGYHLKITYDIITSPSGQYPCTIKQGEPVPLSQPRTAPPYTLDVNLEWVLDGQSRKICWIPPDVMRRGSGGHFWAGASLVMFGSDGVVRKLSFKDPDSY